MSEEDRKYLRSVKKLRPSFEIFEKMVQILTALQAKTDQLLQNSLLLKV